LHSTKWSNGKKKGWETTHLKKNSIQDSVGNEENGNPVPDPNKTMINVSKEPIDIHTRKKTLKEEILEEISEKFMEKILDMINQNVQDTVKKFQNTKNKEHEKTQKQINELREDFNKHQSETRDTIKKRDIN
jgi:small-conductance mechanosensitive channel